MGASTTSSGTPLMKSVKVDEKCTCCRLGARKPVLAAPRTSSAGLTLKLAASLPLVVLPKSL